MVSSLEPIAEQGTRVPVIAQMVDSFLQRLNDTAMDQSVIRELVGELQERLAAEERWKELLVKAFDALPDGTQRQIETITGIGKVTSPDASAAPRFGSG